MALAREVYAALAAVVGAANISEDIGVCETYRCITSQSSAHYGPFDHKTPRPQAVILPGSTEEVQGVIRICNQYKIKFKASTTFWSAMGFIGDDNAVQLDMRRMRYFEIDARNMYAVLEPYVIGAAAQAEAMKQGLNLNIPGVGSSSSVVASSAGWVGFGPQTISMGAASENLLGAEWVLPNGEILRTGSLGAGSGWFCGEGPGPSIRGLLRGKQGTAGAFGVCTRIAVRLHPWPGPEHIPSHGQAPAYRADLPDNFKGYTLCCPDWEAYANLVNTLHQSEIVYLGHRQYNMFGRDIKTGMIKILNDPDGQLADLPGYLADPYLAEQNEQMKIDIQVVLAGMSARDMAWKEKALDTVLARYGCWKNELMQDPAIADWNLLYLLRLGHKNLNYTLCGSYEGNFGLSPNIHVASSVMEEASALKRQWEEETDHMAAVGGDSDMGSLTITGGGGSTGWEFFVHFDAYDKPSIKGCKAFIDATQAWMNQKGLGVDMGRWNANARREDGYDYSQAEQDGMMEKLAQPLVAAYQYKLRQVFNPNDLGGSYYRTLNPEKIKQ